MTTPKKKKPTTTNKKVVKEVVKKTTHAKNLTVIKPQDPKPVTKSKPVSEKNKKVIKPSIATKTKAVNKKEVKSSKAEVKTTTVDIPKIKFIQIGKNLNLVIPIENEEVLQKTKVGAKEELQPIKDLIEKYNNSKSLLTANKLKNQIIDLVTKVEKEIKTTKETKKIVEKANLKISEKKLDSVNNELATRKKLLSSKLSKELFTITEEGGVIKNGTNTVMPELLVDKIIKFISAKKDLSPLLNFWSLCIINPNYKVIPKLFSYIERHNLIITPSGCFVTYRMVKTTDKKTDDGRPIYTSAHTGKENYIIGEKYSIPRIECDDNGARDCSKGLHTGSADFIGITLGDGYNKGEIKTKAQGGGYGTGYGAPDEVVTQKFDNTFGNQAVICIVNPMNVVSVPDSDTRKMRSCELYFAKLTTAEEVLHHLTDEDYLIFDSEYVAKQVTELEVELAEINIKEKTGSFYNFFGTSGSKSTEAKLIERKKELEKEINDIKKAKNKMFSEDLVEIMKNRIVKI